MSLLKLISKFINIKTPRHFFEVKQGDHSCFITSDEWLRKSKENAFINYKLGLIQNSNQLIRIHAAKNERHTHGRQ